MIPAGLARAPIRAIMEERGGITMDTHLKTRPVDKYVTVDGVKLRYIEEGEGLPVLLMHGASLGSSADVFIRNLEPLARAGLRPIAFDFPGYGLSDVGADLSVAYQRDALPKFVDALGLGKVALIAHSRSGGMAVQLALKEPARYTHLAVLGTGTLLPPLPADVEGRYAQVAQRVDRQMAVTEPTVEETKKLMQADLFHTDLVTQDELALRHSRSVGKAFQTFVTRANAAEAAAEPPVPLWQRMLELKIPLLLIFGRNDRAHAGERAELFKKMHPELNLHIVDDCKHMVPWDVADQMIRLVVPFIKGR
jgi:4,5:9,10-diseco-3-hydroxy-5,9,17-trioxoandrosta-1(10),2-diene-4-oate hydrolase